MWLKLSFYAKRLQLPTTEKETLWENAMRLAESLDFTAKARSGFCDMPRTFLVRSKEAAVSSPAWSKWCGC